MVIPVDDVNVPSHQAHLQAEDGVILPVVLMDVLYCVAVGDPNKLLTKEVVEAFVHPIVP
jgi:hypothetical protein